VSTHRKWRRHQDLWSCFGFRGNAGPHLLDQRTVRLFLQRAGGQVLSARVDQAFARASQAVER